MLSRAAFILITIFWLSMNVLLLRPEFGPDRSRLGAVPPELSRRFSLEPFLHKPIEGLSHGTRVAEEMADRIGIIHQGRLIAVGHPDELRRQSGASGPLGKPSFPSQPEPFGPATPAGRAWDQKLLC